MPQNPPLSIQYILIAGKNGTGKTTILNSLGAQLNELKKGILLKSLRSIKEDSFVNISHSYVPK